jgi:hypothetical protein
MSEDKQIDPDLIAAIKQQVIEDMKSEETRKAEEAKIRREQQKEEHDKYVEMMKASPDPWVEVEGWTETAQGVRAELEWNDAFVAYLREQGIPGTDDEQVVQRWVAMLLYDMASQMDEKAEDEQGDFE